MGIVKLSQPDIAKRTEARTDKDWRAIEKQPIDQVRSDKSGRGTRPAFDQQIVDIVQIRARFGTGQMLPDRIVGLELGKIAIFARQDSARWRARFEPGQPDIELRLIRYDRTAPNNNHIRQCPFNMGMGAGFRSSNPLARAIRQGHLPIQRGRELQCDMRAPLGLAGEKASHRAMRLFSLHAFSDGDAGVAQPGGPGAVGAWIGILGGNDDASGSGFNKQIRAGRTSIALMRTGFEGYVDICPARIHAIQCIGFCMRSPAGLRPTARDDLAVSDYYTANIGIGRRLAPAAPGQGKRCGHEPFVSDRQC